MSSPPPEKDVVIAKSVSGTADEIELNTSIASAWRMALTAPKERAEIAALLGAQENELDPNNPPFRAEVRGSGVFGSEILILIAVAFALGFAEEFGKGLGRLAGREASDVLRNLWINHIRERVSPLGTGRLGPEKEDIQNE